MGILLFKKFFDLMTGKGRKNSIFRLDDSISCFGNHFGKIGLIGDTFVKEVF
jgi:hypothetical protein